MGTASRWWACGSRSGSLRLDVERQALARGAADGALQAVAPPLDVAQRVVEQVEGAAPRVEQRHGAQQDLLGDVRQVERRGDGEPHVVDRLALDAAVLGVEVEALEAGAHAAEAQADGEQEAQRVGQLVGERPLSSSMPPVSGSDGQPLASPRPSAAGKSVAPRRAQRLEAVVAVEVGGEGLHRQRLAGDLQGLAQEERLGAFLLEQREQAPLPFGGDRQQRRVHAPRVATRVQDSCGVAGEISSATAAASSG